MKYKEEWQRAAEIRHGLGILGHPVVFTNGCFDILHVGHISLLKFAKQSIGNDVMVFVGINSDKSARRLKGEGRPINDLFCRMYMLRATKYVHTVIPFDQDTPYALIKLLKPDYLVKGAEYVDKKVVGADIVGKAGGRVMYAPRNYDISTTKILQAMKGKR